MARQVHDRDISRTLAAADQWIKTCLVEDGSLFSQSPLWTAQLVDEVYHAFVEHPDLGEDEPTFHLTLIARTLTLAGLAWAIGSGLAGSPRHDGEGRKPVPLCSRRKHQPPRNSPTANCEACLGLPFLSDDDYDCSAMASWSAAS
jgi:hypothetical protein